MDVVFTKMLDLDLFQGSMQSKFVKKFNHEWPFCNHNLKVFNFIVNIPTIIIICIKKNH